jgi:hypothetical protein
MMLGAALVAQVEHSAAKLPAGINETSMVAIGFFLARES